MPLNDTDYTGGSDSITKATYSPKQFRQKQSNAQFWESIQNRSKSRFLPRILVVGILVALALPALKRHQSTNLIASGQTSSKPTNIGLRDQPLGLPVAPEYTAFPPSGSVRYYVQVDPSTLVSAVTIKSAGGHDFNYVIRLRHPATKGVFMDAYLGPGQMLELWLPRGPFEAVVFTGRAWRGQDQLFWDGAKPSPIGAPFLSETGGHYNISLGAPVVSIDRSRF